MEEIGEDEIKTFNYRVGVQEMSLLYALIVVNQIGKLTEPTGSRRQAVMLP